MGNYPQAQVFSLAPAMRRPRVAACESLRESLIDDGLLNVNLVGTVSHWEALKELRRLGRGQHTKHPKVRYFTAREIRIECDPLVEVAADGELIGRTPATFVVKPKALPVLMIQ